jgi:hypothetical protein
MDNNIKMTIARIVENTDGRHYVVEDIFTSDEYEMTLTGKQRMNHSSLKMDEEVYVRFSTLSGNKCRLTTLTDVKMDESQRLSFMKYEVDQKRKEL